MAEGATDRIVDIIWRLAEDNEVFTNDDIRPHLPADVSPRAIPAAVGKARRDGLIVEVDRVRSKVPERKGSLVGVFRAGHKPPIAASGQAVGGAAGTELEPAGEMASEVLTLRTYLEARGYLVGAEELAALLLMLTTRSWVVLAGPTGTGKSSVVRLLAEAVQGELVDIQVKPNWTSSDDVLGYYSEISGRFLPGRLHSALVEAADTPRPFFVRFDEMNLASPEYYLAEVLSAAEHWSTRDGRRQSSAISLPPMPDERRPAPAALSDNVFLVGTLNMDETAKVLSPKVLDRAAVYDLHHVDLYSLPDVTTTAPPVPALPRVRGMLERRVHGLADVRAVLTDDDVQLVGDLLSQLEPHLRSLGAPVGYRQRDALLSMLAVWRASALGEVLTLSAALDVGLRATVLPKLQGSSGAAIAALRSLATALLEAPDLPADAPRAQLRAAVATSRFPRTLERVLDMLDQAEDLGYFSAW